MFSCWNVRMAWSTLSLFDEISILFEKTQQSLGPRNVVWNIGELSRTISRFHQNNDNVVQVPRRFVQKGGELPTAVLALICRSGISRSACYSGCCERTFRILMATWHILDTSARTVCKRAWSRTQSQQCSTSQSMLHPLSTLYLSG